jgi:hypothetical protein
MRILKNEHVWSRFNDAPGARRILILTNVYGIRSAGKENKIKKYKECENMSMTSLINSIQLADKRVQWTALIVEAWRCILVADNFGEIIRPRPNKCLITRTRIQNVSESNLYRITD